MSFDGDSLFGVDALPIDTWFDADGLGAALVFPLSLASPGYWRAPYGGAPWNGELTAGSSYGRTLDDPAAPSGGTPQNGYVPAAFNGGALLVASGSIDDYIGVGTAFEFFTVDRLTQPSIGSYPDSTPVYDCPQIWGDQAGNIGLAVSNGGLRFWMYDSIGGTAETAILSVGSWSKLHIIQGGWDGANIWLSVDGGTPVTAAITTQNALFNLRFGVNYDDTDYLVSDGFERGFMLAPLSPLERAAYLSYARARYGIADPYFDFSVHPDAVYRHLQHAARAHVLSRNVAPVVASTPVSPAVVAPHFHARRRPAPLLVSPQAFVALVAAPAPVFDLVEGGSNPARAHQHAARQDAFEVSPNASPSPTTGLEFAAFPDAIARRIFGTEQQDTLAAPAPDPEQTSAWFDAEGPVAVRRPWFSPAQQLATTELSPDPEQQAAFFGAVAPERTLRATFVTAEQPTFAAPVSFLERSSVLVSTSWPDTVSRPALGAARMPSWASSPAPIVAAVVPSLVATVAPDAIARPSVRLGLVVGSPSPIAAAPVAPTFFGGLFADAIGRPAPVRQVAFAGPPDTTGTPVVAPLGVSTVYVDAIARVVLRQDGEVTVVSPERPVPLAEATFPQAVARPSLLASSQVAVTGLSPRPEQLVAYAAAIAPDRVTRPVFLAPWQAFVPTLAPAPERPAPLVSSTFPDRAQRAPTANTGAIVASPAPAAPTLLPALFPSSLPARAAVAYRAPSTSFVHRVVPAPLHLHAIFPARLDRRTYRLDGERAWTAWISFAPSTLTEGDALLFGVLRTFVETVVQARADVSTTAELRTRVDAAIAPRADVQSTQELRTLIVTRYRLNAQPPFEVGAYEYLYADFFELDPVTRVRALANPTTVTLTVRAPSGATTVLTYPAQLVRSATGQYYGGISINEAGKWLYRWSSTGVAQGVFEGSFTVKTPSF